MKQTIEEAANEYSLKKYEGTYSMAITSFKAGAKWQAEQSPWVSVKEHFSDAEKAIEIAEQEMREKAIEAYKKACTCIGCNHCNDCDSVREFIQFLNS